MAARRIGLQQMPFRNAVVAEQQMVVVLEIIFRARDQRCDVIGMIVIRLLHRDLHLRREFLRDFFHAHDGGFVAGHRVMREQRDEQRFRHALVREFFHGEFNGRILITHREFHRHGEALLQQFLNIAAAGDERGAILRPNLFVSLAGFVRPLDENRANYQATQRPSHIDHAPVHQKFIQITAHIWHRRRVGRTKIDEENGFAHKKFSHR